MRIEETPPKISETTPEIPSTTPKVTTPSVTMISTERLTSKYHAYQVLKKHPSFRLLTGSHCGFGFLQHRIGHGRNADPGEIPWIVMLRTSVWLGETSLVNTLDCMDTEDGSKICADPPQKIMIEEAIPHPNFSYKHRLRGLPNDIGLVRLAEEADLSPFVRPICLAGLANLEVQSFMNIDYNALTVAGWGMVSMKVDPLSNDLQVVNVTVVEREKCNKLYRREPHKCHICAGGTTGNACKGDSGGPLMAQVNIQ
ncbi:hypothetical protein B566_EDAN008405 [Ephemera danica]|nr:hypothetical protein B566_EDAN008405 [Ephemera danica]